MRLRVHYLFGRLLLFHTVPNYNIHYFPAKPLHYAFKATLFSCKKTNKQGEEGGSQGQRGSEFRSRLFTWLAACSSSFPSPITTYVMLVPKRETIRSKQLSLPGDKQTGFHRVFICLDGDKTHERGRAVCSKGEGKETRRGDSQARTHTCTHTQQHYPITDRSLELILTPTLFG